MIDVKNVMDFLYSRLEMNSMVIVAIKPGPAYGNALIVKRRQQE